MFASSEDRIPGPAGDIVSGFSSHLSTQSKDTARGPGNDGLQKDEQIFADVFSQSNAWNSMRSVLESDPPPTKLLSQVCKSGSSKKIARLAVSIVCLECIYDAYATFRDDSGLMQGTIHRKVFEEHNGLIEIGSVLVLKNVAVFSPTASDHFLNVCPSNIEQVFPYSVRRDAKYPAPDAVDYSKIDEQCQVPRTRPVLSQESEQYQRSVRQKVDHNIGLLSPSGSKPSPQPLPKSNFSSQSVPFAFPQEMAAGIGYSSSASNKSEKLPQFEDSNVTVPECSSKTFSVIPSPSKTNRKKGVSLAATFISENSSELSSSAAYLDPDSAAINVHKDPITTTISSPVSSIWKNTTPFGSYKISTELTGTKTGSSQVSYLKPSAAISCSQSVELPDINMDLLEENALEL